ncbi:MAG TPA: ABC transporter ATP-binding protein [Bacteroidales bacterium]|nr:ABC transporter ATP-binding protein [Bacteroidales bacterium]
MNYNLNKQKEEGKNASTFSSLKMFLALIKEEKKTLWFAFFFIILNAFLSLFGPYFIAHTIDTYVAAKNYHGIMLNALILLAIYIVAFGANYLQMILMGGVGQRMLFSLRNAVFNKLQSLPVDFFHQNKAGDLISRINNDTDKLNIFFSQSLMQFIGNIITMLGSAIFLLTLNFPLGLAALVPAVLIWIFTKSTSPWVKRRNALNLKSVGALSGEVQESLDNYKVIVAFNRRDYFRKKFEEANEDNYKTSVDAGISNNIYLPVYSFAANIGQLIVLGLGIYLITKGAFTIGLLIGFIAYVNNFYFPLRHLAGLWANFQVAMAGWDRIRKILNLENNLTVVENKVQEENPAYIEFRDVSFTYPNGKEVLHHINIKLERGKTYAFVGPTGGGKTTMASLIARLYDTSKGHVLLEGRDIRSFEADERTRKIGFILQEPFLFSGTVRENILYGNENLQAYTNGQLAKLIHESGLETLLGRFEQGLDTQVFTTGDSISLGQKQLIAFMRAVLRKPELIILDEATANIDTITEKLLSDILLKLPASTTRVVIAHRLNTIENADEIFFVNSGKVTPAGSLEDAVNMLLHGKRAS